MVLGPNQEILGTFVATALSQSVDYPTIDRMPFHGYDIRHSLSGHGSMELQLTLRQAWHPNPLRPGRRSR